MYLLWARFQSRYIESPANPGASIVFTSANGGNSEGAGIHHMSFVSVVAGSITGDGFFMEGKAGGVFNCFHGIWG
jgi:hypothetical protein